MTPGPPASEDVFGQLATMRAIPVIVLDDSAAAAPLACVLADAGLPCAEITLRPAAGEAALSIMAQQQNLLVGAGADLGLHMAVKYGAAHGALAMTTLGDTSTARKEEVDNLVVGAGARVDR